MGGGLALLGLGAVYALSRGGSAWDSSQHQDLGADAGAVLDAGGTSDADVAAAGDAGAAPKAADSGAAEAVPLSDELPETLEAQREQLFEHMAGTYSAAALSAVRKIFAESTMMGQGNPKPTQHPLKRSECLERRSQAKQIVHGDPRCPAPNMVPVYAREPLSASFLADGGALPEAGLSPQSSPPTTADTAEVCIDQFEFPNVPCEYPVVYARASEADALCKAVGKRLCDAHEWEGACAGSLRPLEVEYAFGDRRMLMQWFSNKFGPKVWAYGPEKDHSKCGTGSFKNKKCGSGSWSECGSNTYPAGSFPECVSPFGVYDQHGNAAEHMNMPLAPEQLASRGGLGETEMKGSWFIFGGYEAHPDDCRYRAPAWHVTQVGAADSHRNFHLGFRCCAGTK